MAPMRASQKQKALAMTTAALLAAALLALSIFFGISAARARNGGLKRLPAAPAVRDVSEYAFDVNENLAICTRALRRVRRRILPRRDYAARINGAMRDLSAVGGGTVVLDGGVYALAAQLWVPSNVCLRGRGMMRTILRMRKNSAPFRVAGMLRVQNASRVSLLDFTLDGARNVQRNSTFEQRYGRYGLYATEFSHMWVRGVRAVNHNSYGFDPHGTRKTWSHYLVIEGCVAEQNGLDGFTLDQTKHISLLDSIARRNARHGVNIVTGSANVLVRRVSATLNGAADVGDHTVGCGIIAQNNDKELQTRDCIIDDSIVAESPRGGICLSDVINVTISNTRALLSRFPTSPCFLLRSSRSVALLNSTCVARSLRRVSALHSTWTDDDAKDVKAPSTRSLPFAAELSAPDPLCRRGKRLREVCCPLSCARCGGPSCAVAGPSCCTRSIRAANDSCDKAGAPCVLRPENLPPPYVEIDVPVAVPPGVVFGEQHIIAAVSIPEQTDVPKETPAL